MDKRTKIVLTGGALLFLVTLLCPPWVRTYDKNGAHGGHSRSPAGYAWLFSPPDPNRIDANGFALVAPDPEYQGIQLDSHRLLVEWAGLTVILVFVRLVAPQPKPQTS